MRISLIVRPDVVRVAVRAVGPDAEGDIFRHVHPGGQFFGIPFEELVALGSGGHDIEPRPPRGGDRTVGEARE